MVTELYVAVTLDRDPTIACKIGIGKESLIDRQGLAFRKGFPYFNIFQAQLQIMLESGVFEKFARYVTNNLCSTCNYPTRIVHSWVQKRANFMLEKLRIVFFAHRSGLFLPGKYI